VSAKLIELIDTNSNGAFSAEELRRYGDVIVDDLVATVDGVARPVTLISLQGPSVADLRSGAGALVLTAVAAGSEPTREFTFADSHRPLKGPAQASLLAEPNTPTDVKIIRDIDRGIRIQGSFGETTKPADGSLADDTVATTSTTKRTKTLQRYLSEASSPWAMGIALAAAALLGALHALTPGHGKTIAAAYLIGERATVRHAITLGLSTTVTHTSSVLLLGAMSLGFANFIDASTLLEALRIGSGLVIVGLGLFLLVKRLRGRGHTVAAGRGHTHGHGHSHGDSHGHGHGHGHSHGHSHEHARVHADGHSAGNGAVTTRRLVAMGASGGLLPCPEALGVLILAVGVNRQVFGMAMIVAFSAGLASVLVAVGIALVRAGGLVQRFAVIPESIVHTWLPVASAAVVTVLGIAILLGRVV
jgi:nickel/cobalt transporter (NicO) family protein